MWYPLQVMIDVETIRRRFELLSPYLDEKTRRLMAGAEAHAIGFGGISIVIPSTPALNGAASAVCEVVDGTNSRLIASGLK